MKRSQAPRSVGKLVNAYELDRDLVTFFRDHEGKLHRKVERVSPTCFFKAKDLGRAQAKELERSPVVSMVREEGDFLRVEWRDADALKRLTRKGGLFDQREIQTYEADVSPVRRWLTDNPQVQVDKPRRCYLDLEADNRVPFQQKHMARILAWAVVDGETGEALSEVLAEDEDECERELLVALWRTLANYDQVCAWSGARYDFPLLEDRTLIRGISVEHKRWLWLDQLVLFRRMNVTASESGEEKQSFSLDAVAKAILGEGKLELDEDELEGLDEDETIGGQAWEVWKRHPDKLRSYCQDDAEKLYRIEEKTGYVAILQAVCEACATFPDTWGINPTVQVEGFLMRLGAERGMRFRTHQYDPDTKPFKGADVLDVQRGMHREEVHVLDFARMYPSIIISWNMSPETLRPNILLKEDLSTRPSYLSHLPQKFFPIPDGHCASATDAVFVREPQGILPSALEEILEQRKQWSKREAECAPGTPDWQEAHRRAIAYKQIANCFYGVIASPFSRFYVRQVGESISRTGAWLLQHVIAEGRKRGFRTILADTDSNGFTNATREQAREFAEWCNTDLFPRLLAERKAPRNLLKIEYEKAFRRICILVKKRYFAMWAHYKGKEATAESKPEVKGLEYKRGDSARLTRRLQEEIIHAILGYRRKAPVDDPRELEPVVERYMRAIFDEPIELEDVVQSKKIAKPLNEYARKEKKAPPIAKLRGEDIEVVFGEHDCVACGAVPASQLELASGRCQCGQAWRRRKASAKGIVLRASGERFAVCDGRRTVQVWAETVETLTAYRPAPKHVQIAKQLQMRGRDIGKGVRVEFIVVDEGDPFGTIPAEDFGGEIDRYAMWATVFEPTRRVLEVAFPSHSWARFVRLRPQEARAQEVRVKRAAVKALPSKQRSLF